MSIQFNSISITPNPVAANNPFIIVVDVEHIIDIYKWADLKLMPWVDVKQMTWEELSPYKNIYETKFSGTMISGQDFGF